MGDTIALERVRFKRARDLPVVSRFDVEEHHRIEAAACMEVAPILWGEYTRRMTTVTRWILDELEEHDIHAAFFVVGQIADYDPGFIRTMVQAGHEVASDGWDHRRILTMQPHEFREDALSAIP